MFTEILRIKPSLDPAATARMEQTLSKRFNKVAKTFSGALKAVVKSSVIGIGLGLLASLLNPLQELEERIKKLLGQGDDLTEQADKFGTTPGALKQLENVAGLQGVTPEKLSTLMNAFVNALETAKKEMEEIALDPSKSLSQASSAVEQFVGQKDQAQAFFSFIQGLKKFGQSAGTDRRSDVEKAVFGERLYGPSRKFVESNFGSELQRLSGAPSPEKVTAAANKLTDLQRLLDAKNIVNQTQDLVGSANKVTPSIVAQMAQREKEEATRNRNEIDQYANLAKAARSLQNLTDLATQLKDLVITGLGHLEFITGWIKNLLPSLPSLPSIGKGWMSWIGGAGMPSPLPTTKKGK